MTVGEIVLLIRKLVLEETFKVYSTDNNHISTLTYIEILRPRRDKIMLDNTDFKQKHNSRGKTFLIEFLVHTILQDDYIQVIFIHISS